MASIVYLIVRHKDFPYLCGHIGNRKAGIKHTVYSIKGKLNSDDPNKG